MGGFAARKALEVVKHVEQVLAIELLAACQALEFHRPKTTTAPLEAVHKLVRTVARYVVKLIFFLLLLSLAGTYFSQSSRLSHFLCTTLKAGSGLGMRPSV